MRLPLPGPAALPRVVEATLTTVSRRVADGSRRNAGQALVDLQARRADSDVSADLRVTPGPASRRHPRRTA
jgi:hypothetical protein